MFGILWLTRGSFPNSFRHDALNKLARIFKRIISPLCHDFEIINYNDQICFIMNYSDHSLSEGISAFFYEASVLFEPYPFLKYVLGLGKLAKQPQSILQSYKSAEQAIASRVFYGYNKTIDANVCSLVSETSPKLSGCNSAWKEIDISLDILDRDRLKEAISHLCQQMHNYFSKNPALTLEWFKTTAINMLNKITEIHNANQQLIQQKITLVSPAIEDCENYDDLTSCLCEIVLNTLEIYSNNKEINDNLTIQTAKKYIHNNYSEVLDLASVPNRCI